MQRSHPELKRTPWKSIGCLPDDQNELQQYINSAPTPEEKEVRARGACYGDFMIDRVIKEERPSVYVGVQDIWGVDYSIDKPWFSKITSVIWTTLDSLPLLPRAVEVAPRVKNYWVWSSFAELEMRRLGHGHVKTFHGPVDDKALFRLNDEERRALRARSGIENDSFVVLYVFRNQLRKSVPSLLEGYQLWKSRNVGVKSKLILMTHFGEGWPIMRLAEQYGVNKDDILTVYACRTCRGYEVKNFTEPEAKCRLCNVEKSQITTNVNFGINESQLNEVYNLSDVFVSPITSGGQEQALVESGLTESVVLVTNYSCGEEYCSNCPAYIPLKWAKFTEHGTNFIKASTCPVSIADELDRVYKMTPEERRALGKMAREYILDKYSIRTLGRQLEDFLDKCPKIDPKIFDETQEAKNPNAIIPDIEDDKEWVKKIYQDILKMNVDDNDSGLLHWLNVLSSAK